MSTQKHFVLTLDAWVQPPEFNFDHDVAVTPNATPPDPEKLSKATILMTSGTPVTEAIIDGAHSLQMVQCNGTGTDHIDKAALKKRDIKLCHVPAQNTDSVSEHAIALYFALRRRLMSMHALTMDGVTWPKCIIGYGALGKNIEKMATGLGMKVIIAEHKGATSARPGRTLFEEALKIGTVFTVVAPLDNSTRGMIGAIELAAMQNTAYLINVGRGGIVDEAALVEALRTNKIAGAGVDTFEHEPAGKGDSPLIDPTIPNLILTPHIAWYSTTTIANTIKTIKSNIEAWAAGKPQNLVQV